MSWLELQLTVGATQQPRAEATLESLGALSITLLDADAETPDERAIFEPGVGETPLWNALVLQALFDADADRAGLTHALADLVPGLLPALPVCPAGGVYRPGTAAGLPPSCSIPGHHF